jgi:hypothetical protein
MHHPRSLQHHQKIKCAEELELLPYQENISSSFCMDSPVQVLASTVQPISTRVSIPTKAAFKKLNLLTSQEAFTTKLLYGHLFKRKSYKSTA